MTRRIRPHASSTSRTAATTCCSTSTRKAAGVAGTSTAVPAGPPWWEELVAKVDPHLVEDVQHIIAVRRPARSPCQCQSLAAAAGFPPRAALCAEPELSLSVARQIRKTAAGILFVSGVVVGVVLSQLVMMLGIWQLDRNWRRNQAEG